MEKTRTRNRTTDKTGEEGTEVQTEVQEDVKLKPKKDIHYFDKLLTMLKLNCRSEEGEAIYSEGWSDQLISDILLEPDVRTVAYYRQQKFGKLRNYSKVGDDKAKFEAQSNRLTNVESRLSALIEELGGLNEK